MQTLLLPSEQIFRYMLTGKFKALSSSWKHEKFPLETDYELVVMTEGTLFLRYQGENFTIDKGEYLLLPQVTPFGKDLRKPTVLFTGCIFQLTSAADFHPFCMALAMPIGTRH